MFTKQNVGSSDLHVVIGPANRLKMSLHYKVETMSTPFVAVTVLLAACQQVATNHALPYEMNGRLGKQQPFTELVYTTNVLDNIHKFLIIKSIYYTHSLNILLETGSTGYRAFICQNSLSSCWHRFNKTLKTFL